MVKVVIVEKTGNLKESKTKDLNEDNFFKLCGFRKADNFDIRNTWERVKINNEKYTICLFAKNEGKANTENKYDLPPPVDNTLFFGNMLLMRKDEDNQWSDLLTEEWEKIYEKLFGGFEDLNQTAVEDEDEEDELEEIPSSLKTKAGGYLKDGFVVDDEDDISSVELTDTSENVSNEDEDEDDEGTEVNDELNEEDSELDYEEYVFSD
jgi:hypothetical protein